MRTSLLLITSLGVLYMAKRTFDQSLAAIADMADKVVTKETLTAAVNDAVDIKTADLKTELTAAEAATATVKTMVEALADAADGADLPDEVQTAIDNLSNQVKSDAGAGSTGGDTSGSTGAATGGSSTGSTDTNGAAGAAGSQGSVA